MQVRLASPAQKDLDRLPDKIAFRVAVLIKALEANPFPPSSKKLQSWQKTYRARLGNYRVVYEVVMGGRLVEIQRVRHRKDVYRT